MDRMDTTLFSTAPTACFIHIIGEIIKYPINLHFLHLPFIFDVAGLNSFGKLTTTTLDGILIDKSKTKTNFLQIRLCTYTAKLMIIKPFLNQLKNNFKSISKTQILINHLLTSLFQFTENPMHIFIDVTLQNSNFISTAFQFDWMMFSIFNYFPCVSLHK